MPSNPPLSLALGRFKQVPQRSSEVWQGGLVRLPAWIDNPDRPDEPAYRPTGALWVSLRTGRVNLQLSPERGPASADLALSGLFEFAAKESKALGGRPARLEVRGPELKEALEAALAGTGTAVITVDELPAVKEVLRTLERAEYRVPYPGLLDTPGMTIDRVRAFAEAAALFYEARPWRHLSNEDLIQISQDTGSDFPHRPEGEITPNVLSLFMCVLGNGGQQFGLAFFESRRAFERLLDQLDPRRTRRAFGVTFGPLDDLSFADADLWEDYALPVAGPLAYPVAADFRTDAILRPNTATLAYMEGLLRALVGITEDELDSGRWQRRVSTFDGPMTMTLSLPYLLEAEQPTDDVVSGFSRTLEDVASGFNRTRPPRPAIMPRLAERSSVQIARFLEQREFASLDEVNRAIEEAQEQGVFDQPPEVAAGRPLTALEQAQELAYDATEATGRLRIKLARKALSISSDCADACVILGDAAATSEEALDWYQRGVDAGARAIGPERLANEVGQFWDEIDTRPYMRARVALAQTLQSMERVEEALEQYRELLRLNPNDNQGVRYLLLTALLEHRQDEEAGRLLAEYEDEIQAIWFYGRALWLFRREGDSVAARAALQEAARINVHVVGYLLKPESLPWRAPHFALGSKEEAAYAVDELFDAFERTSGALAWVKARVGHLRARKKRR